MKNLLILILLTSNSFGMGDPNFIPANPAQVRPEINDMVHTTSTLNQVDQQKNRQEQEAKKKNKYRKKKSTES